MKFALKLLALLVLFTLAVAFTTAFPFWAGMTGTLSFTSVLLISVPVSGLTVIAMIHVATKI